MDGRWKLGAGLGRKSRRAREKNREGKGEGGEWVGGRRRGTGEELGAGSVR